ncbi:hypothetical protein [Candidatus Stoquefichus massiliensis]|uniref:hypothetical protein n=1 Tax=Candidatus Stoquefichus massiliensis TaxID=1470350 RepID=UPI00048683BC|nr:hypothetical protein [Candidatus Stoquefichus massiliensis]
MEAKLKQSYIQEIQYQTHMLNNLQRWLKNFIIFSSISLVLILFGPSVHPVLKIIGIVLMILSVIGCIVIGLGFRNGKENVHKLINMVEKRNAK